MPLAWVVNVTPSKNVMVPALGTRVTRAMLEQNLMASSHLGFSQRSS